MRAWHLSTGLWLALLFLIDCGGSHKAPPSDANGPTTIDATLRTGGDGAGGSGGANAQDVAGHEDGGYARGDAEVEGGFATAGGTAGTSDANTAGGSAATGGAGGAGGVVTPDGSLDGGTTAGGGAPDVAAPQGGATGEGGRTGSGGVVATGGSGGGTNADAFVDDATTADVAAADMPARDARTDRADVVDASPPDAAVADTAPDAPEPDPIQGEFPWVWTFDSGKQGFSGSFTHNAAEGTLAYDGTSFSGWMPLNKRFDGADWTGATSIQIVFRLFARIGSTPPYMAAILTDGAGKDCGRDFHQEASGWVVDMGTLASCSIDLSDIRSLSLRFYAGQVSADTAIDSITVFGINPGTPPDPDPPLLHYTFDGHLLNTGTVSGYDATGDGIFVAGAEGLALHDGHVSVNNWGSFIRARDRFELTIRYQREQPYVGDNLFRCKQVVNPRIGFMLTEASNGLQACWVEGDGGTGCGQITTSADPLTGWHTVTIRWDSTVLSILFDGQPRYEVTPPGNPFQVLTTERLFINESDHDGYLMDDIRISDHFSECVPGAACCDPDGTRCDFGCDTGTGQCWPACDPTGTCCQPDGTTCSAGCNTATGQCWPECNPSATCCAPDGTWATNDEVQQPTTSRYWKRCALGQTWVPGSNCRCTGSSTYMSWCNASGNSGGGCVPDHAGSDACALALGAGHRLPSRAELVTLLSPCDTSVLASDPGYCTICQDSSTCKAMFTSDQNTAYWTSSEDTRSVGSNNAWYALFGAGYVGSIPKSESAFVRCLR